MLTTLVVFEVHIYAVTICTVWPLHAINFFLAFEIRLAIIICYGLNLAEG